MAKVRDVVASEGASAMEERPKLVVRLGRGNVGGTTGLDAQIQLARAAGRSPIIFDGALNPTLALLYREAIRPESYELPDVKRALTTVLDTMVEERRSAAIDLGGGQSGGLASFVRDLELLEYCEAMGITPVAQFYLGPDLEDLRHAMAVWDDGGFQPPQTLAFLNEGVLRMGQTTTGVFDALRAQPSFTGWVRAGARPILMTRLACMEEIRNLGLTLTEAVMNIPNKDGRRIGPTNAWSTKKWLERLQKEAAEVGAGEWLL
jgi:hypothetical protein